MSQRYQQRPSDSSMGRHSTRSPDSSSTRIRRASSTGNSKDKKIVAILLVAAVIAIITGILLYFYLVPKRTTFYVFNDNYKAGQPVTFSCLTPVEADSNVFRSNSKKSSAKDMFVTSQNADKFIGQSAGAARNNLRMDVAKGMPLTIAMLSVDGGSYLEQMMDKGDVAITIPVTSVSGVSSQLQNNSRVNIYASGYGDDSSETSLIFEAKKVLKVNRDDDGELESATIEMTPQESTKLVDAENNATLYLGLVGSDYYAGNVGATASINSIAPVAQTPGTSNQSQSKSSSQSKPSQSSSNHTKKKS